ncbi:hypothetical protein H1W37_11465 [Stappia taiwanensis]|uniref:CheA signal transduction histidine kinase n=1 Tax=Stappia taiwanensis TaxID=992267 RepID=A0A838XP62_9HYPH|nr:hypothetical protein [Stappia taiwanensis]MBA4612275.1 hypothetical protein [Stappia taiwanensis]GGF04127.1 hypothetical protein GCM10007285_34900 [Stappia taiwanensis]
MADYYSVLKKTVGALPQNTGAARREIYQRARKAIVAQLKAYDPPLSPSEITTEQLRLEEAIRKIEAEAARETLGVGAAPVAPTPPRPAPKQPAPAAPTPPPAPAKPASAPAPAPEATKPAASPAAGPATDSPTVAPPSAAAPDAPAAPAAPEDPSHRVFKDAIDDAKKLGSAADQASRTARGALTGAPEEPVRREPTMGPATPAPEAPAPAAAPSAPTAAKPAAPGKSAEKKTSPRRAKRDRRPLPGNAPSLPAAGPSRLPMIVGVGGALLVLIGIGAVGYSQRDTIAAMFGGGDEPVVETKTETPPATEPVRPAEPASKKNTARLLDNGETSVAPDARTVTTTRIRPSDPAATATAPAQPAPATAPAEPPRQVTPAETPDTTTAETPAGGQDVANATPPAAVTPPPATTAPAATTGSPAVAQRAILYEEGAEAGSAGQASAGNAVWRVEEETIDGRKETVLRMRVEVPERNIAADLTLKPNRDSALPASHLLEVRFELPDNFAGQGVGQVPGLVMKTTEEARGDALIGASVKVSDDLFWVALSNLPDEQERNLTLLRDRGWIDIPMLYENGKRAILTLEKGTPGTRAIEQATDAWGKAG